MSGERTSHIVGIGGGTGLPILLTGLRQLASTATNEGPVSRPGTPTQDFKVSAIVTVTDDGGSTGQLRHALRVPALGDLRNCVAALADDQLLRQLFQHRFLSAEGLHGHALGNLVLAALCQRSGSLKRAIDEAGGLLGSSGVVLPVTEQDIVLCAELADGTTVRGEVEIAAARQKISRVWTDPLHPEPAPGVLETIASADVVVIGPGSLYTSLVPNLVIPGVVDAIRESMALRVFVCNLMTQAGETDGFTAVDHLEVIEQYLGRSVLDVCILNTGALQADAVARYATAGCEPVKWARSEIAARGIVPLAADLADPGLQVNRHDPLKLARIIVSLAARVFPPVGVECTARLAMH